MNNDLVKLRRLLHSGAPPDACDYDRRCALHIAGAEGNLAAVKLLVEEGHADAGFQVGQGWWRRGTRTRASRWGRGGGGGARGRGLPGGAGVVEEGHADAGFQVGQGWWRRGTRTRGSRWGRRKGRGIRNEPRGW